MPRRPWSALLAGLLFTFAASPVLADPPVPKAASLVLNRIKAADTNLLAVSEEDGRFLRFLVVSSGAKKVLEIGGANGYSAIWIGLGLRETGGRLVTIEYDAARAKDAEANIKAAGLSDVVQVVSGDAFKAIPGLPGAFDFVFLDAWKKDYQRFFDLVFPRLDNGGLFVAHNVVNKASEMGDFLTTLRTHPGLRSAIVSPSGEGISVSVSGRSAECRAVRFTSSAYLWTSARAGAGSTWAPLPCASPASTSGLPPSACRHRSRRPARAHPRDARSGRPDEEVHPRDRPRVPEAASRGAWQPEGRRDPAGARGDHSLGAGSVAAASDWARPRGLPIGLIWVDAHGDMNTPASTASGNVHGMPLSALVGPEPQELAGWRRASRRSIPPARCSSASAISTRRRRRTSAGRACGCSRCRTSTARAWPRWPNRPLRQRARERPASTCRSTWTSAIPPIAPGVGTSVRGGLGFREAHLLMEMIAGSGLLTSLDLVEVNPILDVQNTTATLAMDLALSPSVRRFYEGGDHDDDPIHDPDARRNDVVRRDCAGRGAAETAPQPSGQAAVTIGAASITIDYAGPRCAGGRSWANWCPTTRSGAPAPTPPRR